MKVIIVGAPWCASCKTLKRELDGLEFVGFEIEHADLSQNPELGTKWGIKSLPAIVIPDKNLVRTGITTARQLQALLTSL